MLIEGERQEKETRKAMIACNDYLRLGPGRSLSVLLDRYQNDTEPSPTRRLPTLKDWSRRFNWQARVAVYDNRIEQEKTAEAERARIEAMQTGVALDYERVLKLKGLFDKLHEMIEVDGLTYTDIKMSAKGDTVEVETFNKALIDEFRGVLDDVAKETGGRRQKQDISGEIRVDDQLTDEQRAAKIIAIVRAAQSRDNDST